MFAFLCIIAVALGVVFADPPISGCDPANSSTYVPCYNNCNVPNPLATPSCANINCMFGCIQQSFNKSCIPKFCAMMKASPIFPAKASS